MANGTGSSIRDVHIILRFPRAGGHGVDRRVLGMFFDKLEEGLFELELDELADLIARFKSEYPKYERFWDDQLRVARDFLREDYKGRRYQIARASGQAVGDDPAADGSDELQMEIAATAAVFTCLRRSLDEIDRYRPTDDWRFGQRAADALARDGERKIKEMRGRLLSYAVDSLRNTARLLAYKFESKYHKWFDVTRRDGENIIELRAKFGELRREDYALPTMAQFIEVERRAG